MERRGFGPAFEITAARSKKNDSAPPLPGRYRFSTHAFRHRPHRRPIRTRRPGRTRGSLAKTPPAAQIYRRYFAEMVSHFARTPPYPRPARLANSSA